MGDISKVYITVVISRTSGANYGINKYIYIGTKFVGGGNPGIHHRFMWAYRILSSSYPDLISNEHKPQIPR